MMVPSCVWHDSAVWDIAHSGVWHDPGLRDMTQSYRSNIAGERRYMYIYVCMYMYIYTSSRQANLSTWRESVGTPHKLSDSCRVRNTISCYILARNLQHLLQCVAVCSSALQYVTGCCSVLQYMYVYTHVCIHVYAPMPLRILKESGEREGRVTTHVGAGPVTSSLSVSVTEQPCSAQ